MQFAFYKAKDRLFNKLVTWKMEGPYSHVELIFAEPNEFSKTYLCASSSFMDGGVRFCEIELDPAKWDIIEVEFPDDDVRRVKAAIWFQQNVGKPYDVRGLLGFILPFPVGHTKDGWFCDEACLTAIGMEDAFRFDPNSMASVLFFMGGKLVPVPVVDK